jgi:hypothetical protein
MTDRDRNVDAYNHSVERQTKYLINSKKTWNVGNIS